MQDLLSAPQLEQVPTTVDELGPGALLFFARPSLLQSWAEFFGHEWRHVGLTVKTDEGLMVAAFAPGLKYYQALPLDKLPNYTRIGVARVFTTAAEVETLNRWCAEFVEMADGDKVYVFSAPLVGPLHLMARRLSGGLRKALLMGIVRSYCAVQNRRYRNKEAFVCSTFVWAAVQAAREVPFRTPMLSHPEDLTAYAKPPSSDEALLARWLCGPTELWEAVPEHDRAILEPVPRKVEPASEIPRAADSEVVSDFTAATTPTSRSAQLAPGQRVPRLARRAIERCTVAAARTRDSVNPSIDVATSGRVALRLRSLHLLTIKVALSHR